MEGGVRGGHGKKGDELERRAAESIKETVGMRNTREKEMEEEGGVSVIPAGGPRGLCSL